MGLDIYCKHSDKSIRWGYSRIHNVRTLAYIACGVPKKIAKLRMYYGQLSVLDSYRADEERKTGIDELTGSDLLQISATGFHFPQLLWHSDAEGTYTARGKIWGKKNMMTGNIHKLKEELECLIAEDFKNNKKYQKEDIPDFWVDDLKNLYELVKDEVQHKRPVVYFS